MGGVLLSNLAGTVARFCFFLNAIYMTFYLLDKGARVYDLYDGIGHFG